ncbi:MAG: HEAT repeat domain-containing protein [Planctomycetes bacterium]|nr:HEAT repeat domain-containing protein [Planctomycetota bacterium]
MRYLATCSFLLVGVLPASAGADYDPPTFQEVVRKATAIVDATVEGFTEEGYARLTIHQHMKGKDAPTTIKRVWLTCIANRAPHTLLKAKARYVLCLHNDAIFEDSTANEVRIRDDAIECQFRDPRLGTPEWIALSEFRAKLARLLQSHPVAATGDDPPVYKDQPASYWIQALKDPDVEVRREAAYAMHLIVQKTGVEAPPVETLVEALKDEDGRVRLYCALALDQMGPKAKEAVPALIELLNDVGGDFSAAYHAREALEKIGEPAIPALIKALRHEKIPVREQAAALLVQLIRRDRSRDEFARRHEQMVPAFIEALKDKDGRVRMTVASGLAALGPSARAAIPALIETLADQSPPQKYMSRKGPPPEAGPQAAKALAQFGEEAVPQLIQALENENPKVRAGAARVLGLIGDKAKAAEPTLIEALDDTDHEVRVSAATALSQIGADSKSAVPKITQLFRQAIENDWHRNAYDAEMLAAALGRFGPAAKEALPVLINALENRFRLLDEAVVALLQIGPDGLPPVIKLLSHEDQGRRSFAAAALGSIGPKAKPAVPALIRALEDEYYGVRLDAAETLGKIGPEAKAAVPGLITLLKHEYVGVRYRAIVALGKIGPDAKAAVPALIDRFKTDEPGNSKAAVEALKQIDHDAAPQLSQGELQLS